MRIGPRDKLPMMKRSGGWTRIPAKGVNGPVGHFEEGRVKSDRVDHIKHSIVR